MLTMFDTLKTIFRRLFGALITVVGALFGQWQPPFWLRAIGRGVLNLGSKARAYPRRAGGGVLGLVLLAAAGFYGWQWYSNLPQPHTVGYSLHKPNLTDYTQQPAVVDNLQVRFAESVAPLAAIGKPVTAGITLKPAVAGAWRWSDDRTLLFTPEKTGLSTPITPSIWRRKTCSPTACCSASTAASSPLNRSAPAFRRTSCIRTRPTRR